MRSSSLLFVASIALLVLGSLAIRVEQSGSSRSAAAAPSSASAAPSASAGSASGKPAFAMLCEYFLPDTYMCVSAASATSALGRGHSSLLHGVEPVGGLLILPVYLLQPCKRLLCALRTRRQPMRATKYVSCAISSSYSRCVSVCNPLALFCLVVCGCLTEHHFAHSTVFVVLYSPRRAPPAVTARWTAVARTRCTPTSRATTISS